MKTITDDNYHKLFIYCANHAHVFHKAELVDNKLYSKYTCTMYIFIIDNNVFFKSL